MRLKDYLNDFTRENEELKKIKEAMDTQAIIDANSGNMGTSVQDAGDGEKHVQPVQVLTLDKLQLESQLKSKETLILALNKKLDQSETNKLELLNQISGLEDQIERNKLKSESQINEHLASIDELETQVSNIKKKMQIMAKEHEKYKDVTTQKEIMNFAQQITQMHNTMNTSDPSRPSLGLVNKS